MIARAQILLAVYSLCIRGCSVWSVRLAWAAAAGVCFHEPKGNADFAIYKVTQLLHCANGKSANQEQLVVNATLTEPNPPKTVQVWLQLTTGANESPRWKLRAQPTTWRPLTTTQSLLCFNADASKMLRLTLPTMPVCVCVFIVKYYIAWKAEG